MPADFSKYSNYSKENSFTSIVFGADAPLLETELNEMQQIQAERFKDYVNSIHGNIILKEGQITYENNQVTISNYTLLIDGEIVYVSNLSTSASDGDSIYIKIERTEVKYSDVLRKYGNKQEDIIENKLWDERVNQETSRRIAVTYDITTSTPSNMDEAIKMAEIIDGKLVKSYEVLNESKYNIIKTYEDVISVPNDTKGQVSVIVMGNTETDEEGNTKSTISAIRIRSVSEDETQESIQYITAKNNDNKIVILNSLNNGIADTIKQNEQGEFELWKYIGVKENVANGTTIDYDDMADGGVFYAWNDDGETQSGVKGDTLTINATQLIYQLAEPEIIPVHVEGTLQAYKNGTIYFEPALSGKIIFAEGENTKQITTEELPIKSIRKVLRYDILEDGTIREVDVTEDCTHTDTTITINNVIPNVTYFYDCDIPSEYSTSGEKIITFAENIPANVEELIDYKVKNENDKRKISANIKAIESSLSKLNDITSRDIIVISDTKPSDVAIWLEELD